jgi:hypothetical protein
MDHIGIDVHKRDSQIYILAEGGEVVEASLSPSSRWPAAWPAFCMPSSGMGRCMRPAAPRPCLTPSPRCTREGRWD